MGQEDKRQNQKVCRWMKAREEPDVDGEAEEDPAGLRWAWTWVCSCPRL